MTPPASGLRDWRRGLYAITPECADDGRLLAFAEAVLDGGAVLLQYRGKRDAARVRWRRAEALHALCQRLGVPLVVNDDVELAAALGAGVHVGGDDAPVARARQRLGPAAIIGASCYDQPARARLAQADGASYVAFGAFHPSPTKPLARRADPGLLATARQPRLPRVAIGGIRLDNAPALIRAGADLLAVISDLAGHPRPERRAAEFAALFTPPLPAQDLR